MSQFIIEQADRFVFQCSRFILVLIYKWQRTIRIMQLISCERHLLMDFQFKSDHAHILYSDDRSSVGPQIQNASKLTNTLAKKIFFELRCFFFFGRCIALSKHSWGVEEVSPTSSQPGCPAILTHVYCKCSFIKHKCFGKRKKTKVDLFFFSLHLAVNVPFNTSSKHSVTSAVCPFYALHGFLPLLSFFVFVLAFLRLCNSPVVSQEQKRNEFLNELIILHGKVSKTNLAVLWLWLKGKCTLKTEFMWTWVHSQTLFNMNLNFFLVFGTEKCWNEQDAYPV